MGEQEEQYTFSYNESVALPSKLSNSFDFWGYYNGYNTGEEVPENMTPEIVLDDSSPYWNQLFSFILDDEGQAPETIGGARVELYRGVGLIAITAVDPRGHFTFAGVESATYDLSLLWEGRDIQIKGVQIG